MGGLHQSGEGFCLMDFDRMPAADRVKALAVIGMRQA